ncbi:VIT1/CCC1 transporter family protein [Candidatus Woesearchaeota archaeon]|nr:VIT1/CCC1 transporter family protein [Candidatus Woesearchaeota archaeon]
MPSRIEKARQAYYAKNVGLAEQAHKNELIRKQAKGEVFGAAKEQYLAEFVYGAIDGTVTTFAVVAGATGASLSSVVVIILGFANLIADGFSMAVGNFLSEKTQRDLIARERKREEWEIKAVPAGEREEIREIFRRKGFSGKDLDRAVRIVTSNKKVWVDTMMAEELGLLVSPKKPWKTAMATYIGFILIGLIPLLAYVFSYFAPFFQRNTFAIAVVMTLVALFAVGAIKSYVTRVKPLKSVFQTVFVGGAAAAISYYIGFFLRLLITG